MTRQVAPSDCSADHGTLRFDRAREYENNKPAGTSRTRALTNVAFIFAADFTNHLNTRGRAPSSGEQDFQPAHS